MKCFVARALVVVVAILGIVFGQVAPASANAPDDPSNKLANNLGKLWTAVLETPPSENPIVGNGPECWDLGNRTVAQFGPGRVDPDDPNIRSCTVEAGTKIFVVGSSFECSDIPGDDHPVGEPPFTDEELRECATELNDLKPGVTLDGRSVPLTGVVTPALHPVLTEDNILGAPEDTYMSVAHGWVTLLHPLTPGTHTIVITGGVFPDTTTTIVVTPGH
jgi:hypothetical protein